LIISGVETKLGAQISNAGGMFKNTRIPSSDGGAKNQQEFVTTLCFFVYNLSPFSSDFHWPIKLPLFLAKESCI